jgi:hypothetical protein
VGNMNSETGFYLFQYNFTVLFWFSRALNVCGESSSGVSDHKIRSMKLAHIGTEISKWI